MSKYDVRGYRLLRWRWIFFWLATHFFVFSAINILSSGTTGLIIVPAMCLVLGWQLGVVSERNDWHEWSKGVRIEKRRKPTHE